MQCDRNPEEQAYQRVFKRMNAFLQENTRCDKREHEKKGLQKMDRIDFTTSMQQMHDAIERESRENGEAR